MQSNVVKETGVETAGTLSHINNEMKHEFTRPQNPA